MLNKRKKRGLNLIYYLGVGLILLLTLFPILYMFLSSFKRIVDLMNPEKLIIFRPVISNYVDVFTKYSFSKPIWNSLIVALVSTALACVLGLPAAYAIARYRMRGMSIIVLAVRIIPAITFLIPWYIIFSRLKWTGTFAALIIAHLLIALPLIIWIVTPYFESIPHELEQAAFIDGASPYTSFFRVMLPLSGPGIFTAAILAFIYSWNNFIFALVLSGKNTKTLPMAIFNFISYSEVNWSGLMAAAVIITAPVIVISILLQKYVVSGLTAGAVKG